MVLSSVKVIKCDTPVQHNLECVHQPIRNEHSSKSCDKMNCLPLRSSLKLHFVVQKQRINLLIKHQYEENDKVNVFLSLCWNI